MTESETAVSRKGFSGTQVALFILVAVLLTAGLSFWIFRTYIQPADFKPVELSTKEQRTLDGKLQQLGVKPRYLLPDARREDQFDAQGSLVPEKYAESAEKREIRTSERELNAMLASNPNLAKRFAVEYPSPLLSR